VIHGNQVQFAQSFGFVKSGPRPVGSNQPGRVIVQNPPRSNPRRPFIGGTIASNFVVARAGRITVKICRRRESDRPSRERRADDHGP
jgi:hypothetical protein